VVQSALSRDFDEILRWQSRIDELAAGHDQSTILAVLEAFARAFSHAKKWDSAGMMWVRCAEICGASKQFSMQVKVLNMAGDCFMFGEDQKNAALWYESARDVSVEHGFVSMESKSCTKLGDALTQTWRTSEGVEQHRRAWAVAQSVRQNDTSHDRASLERAALRRLVGALCWDGHLQEAESLLTRLRERGGNNANCRIWNQYLRGMIHLLTQNFEDASLSFQAAIDVASQHPEVLEDEEASIALSGAEANLKVCGVGAVGMMVNTATASRDWPGVLRWESRLEELLLTMDDARQSYLIYKFAFANFTQGLLAKATSLFQRRVQVLGKLERFREQGAGMCQVGECFLLLNDAKGAETWYQNARKLGEKHGCYESEGRACLGLGRVELYMRGRLQEAEELLRHALSVLDFVDGKDETFERDIKGELSNVLMQTGHYEEAGPLSQRLRELAERASADPFERVEALKLAVDLQVAMGVVEQARTEMQVQPEDPISHPLSSDSRNQNSASHLRHTPQPAVAHEIVMVCTCSAATHAHQ